MSALNFAIWATNASNNNSPEQLIISELHVNLWKLNEKDSHSVIDFGILYEKPSFDHTINFFIDTDQKPVCEDLNKLLTDSSEMLYTIFNDFVQEKSCEEHYNSSKLVKSTDERAPFCVFQLSDQNYIIKEFSTGYLIEFTNTPNRVTKCKCCASKNAYIRFRLKGSFIEESFVCDENASSKLQNFSSKLTIIETKINVLRVLPTSIREKLQISHPKIKKVNFFMMCPSKESIEISSSQHSSVRCLEGAIWNRYFDKVAKYTTNKQKIFAYQWKKNADKTGNGSRGFEDYSLMVRIKSDKINFSKVLGVLALAIGTGFLGSYFFEIFKSYLPFIESPEVRSTCICHSTLVATLGWQKLFLLI